MGTLKKILLRYFDVGQYQVVLKYNLEFNLFFIKVVFLNQGILKIEI